MAPRNSGIARGASRTISIADLYKEIVVGQNRNLPLAERYRVRFGKDDLMNRIDTCLQQADVGIMLPLTDFSREAVQYDPHVSTMMVKRFGPLPAKQWQLVPAKGPDLKPEIAEDVCAQVRRLLHGIPDFGWNLYDLAFGLFDGRSGLEIQWRYVAGDKFPVQPARIDWIHPRMIALGPARELRAIDSFTAGTGWWWKNGIAFDDVPGKFITWKPRYFGDYVEKEGLARRTLYWTLFKRFSAVQRMIFAELFGKPLRVVEWEHHDGLVINEDSYNDAAEAAESLGAETTANMPVGAKLNMLAQPANNGQLWSMTIEQVNSEMSKLWVGNTGTTDMHPSALGGGATQVHKGEQNLFADLDTVGIEGRIKVNLIDVIVTLNRGPDLLPYAPTLKLRDAKSLNPTDEQGRLNSAITIGVPVALDDYYEKCEIEKPEEDAPLLILVGSQSGHAKVLDPTVEKARAAARGMAADWTPFDGSPQIGLTPTDQANVWTVDEVRLNAGGAPAAGPEGKMTVYAAKVKADAEAQAAIAAAKAPTEPSGPPGGGSGGPPGAPGGPPKPSPSPGGAPPAAGPKPAPAFPPKKLELERARVTRHGSVDDLADRWLAEGARTTAAWAAQIVASVDPDERNPQVLRTALTRAAEKLPRDAFARAIERSAILGAALGALDAADDADAEATEPVSLVYSAPDARGERVLLSGLRLAAAPVEAWTKRPFTEAIDDFLGRDVVTRSAFDRLSADAKRKSFTIAGLAQQRMLEVAHDELVKQLAEGPGLDDFRDRLAERFENNGWEPLNPSHVETIFRNAVGGAYAAGREAQMMQPAVRAARPYWQVRGIKDSRTRATHLAAHGKVFPAGDPDAPKMPMGHRCFMPDTLVEGAVIGASRAWYAGKTVELTTAQGRKLTTTANHPVLTSKGFAPAQSIRKGDELVCYGRGDLNAAPDDHENQAPSRAEDAFRALSHLSPSTLTEQRPDDFHGEARFFQGDVDVVGSYGKLRRDADATRSKHGRKFDLAATDPLTSLESGLGLSELLDERDIATAHRDPSMPQRPREMLGEDLSPLLADSVPLHALRLGLPAHSDTVLHEALEDAAARDAGFIRELLQRDASLVTLDHVIEVREQDYAGHVYDFETSVGWLVANGVVASNCRCFLASLSPRDVEKRGLNVGTGDELIKLGLPDDGWDDGAILSSFDRGDRIFLDFRRLAEAAREPEPVYEDELPRDKAELRDVHGIKVLVNRPKGFVQVKRDEAGVELWRRTYKVDYGEIARLPGSRKKPGGDGDALDVFLGNEPTAKLAYWVVQVHGDHDARPVDELKLFLNFGSERAVIDTFTDHVPVQHFGRIYAQPVATIQSLLGIEPDKMLLELSAARGRALDGGTGRNLVSLARAEALSLASRTATLWRATWPRGVPIDLAADHPARTAPLSERYEDPRRARWLGWIEPDDASTWIAFVAEDGYGLCWTTRPTAGDPFAEAPRVFARPDLATTIKPADPFQPTQHPPITDAALREGDAEEDPSNQGAELEGGGDAAPATSGPLTTPDVHAPNEVTTPIPKRKRRKSDEPK